MTIEYMRVSVAYRMREGDGAVALAEHRHPGVQHQVVEGRMAVVAEGLEHVAQRQRGDVDAERLVEPQRRPLHEPRDHPDGDDGTDRQWYQPGGCARRSAGGRGRGAVVDPVGSQGAHEAAMLVPERRAVALPGHPPW